MAFRFVFDGLKFPVPELLHIPPTALFILPLKNKFAFSQIDLSFPAFADGTGVNLTTSEDVAAGHAPLLVDLNVNKMELLALSKEVNI